MSLRSWDTGSVVDTGFVWGPLRVTRAARLNEGQGAVIMLQTEHWKVHFFVSEKGRRARVVLVEGDVSFRDARDDV